MARRHDVRIDLHPMTLQVRANLKLLRAAKQTRRTKRAIAALKKVRAALVGSCSGMGVDVTYA